MMTWIVALFGCIVAALGISGVVRPTALIDLVQAAWRTPAGLYGAVGLRVLLGVVLIAAAPDCRFPQAIRILGIVALVAAAGGLVAGFERLQRFAAWWTERPAGFVRAWSLVAVAFGAWLVYAAMWDGRAA